MNTIVKPYPSVFPTATNIQQSHSAVRLFAPLLVMTAGTGGTMTVHNAAELSRWTPYSITPLIQVEPLAPKKIDVRSPAEHVANIRDGFAISMSDLATILGITRPTAYAWLKGDEPKPEAIERIQRLSSIADRVKQMNISRLDKLVHRPLSDGRSLFDVLQTDADPTEVLASLQTINYKEAQTRRESKGSGKHLRSLDAVLGESSVPIDLQKLG